MKTAMLAMIERRCEAIFKYLFPGDGLEAAAVLVCNQGTGKQYQRLIVSDVLCLPYRLSERKEKLVSWPFGDSLPPDKISDIDRRGQSIVTIHSHPNGSPRFSEIDDQNDRELFASACNWFDDGRLNGSAVMLPDGTVKARTVDANGKISDMTAVSVVGDNIHIWKPGRQKEQTAYQSKMSQTFGRGTLDLLRTMRVGVVGCSGTGSIIIELLVRNCVEELVIVDNDILEEKKPEPHCQRNHG